jgi:hypothetical protein
MKSSPLTHRWNAGRPGEADASVAFRSPRLRRCQRVPMPRCRPWPRVACHRQQAAIIIWRSADLGTLRGRRHALSAQHALADSNHSHRRLREIFTPSSTRPVYHHHGQMTLHCAICGRIIPLYQSPTLREWPFDCTARCAPSRCSSLRCGPPLTLLDRARSASGLVSSTSRWSLSLKAIKPKSTVRKRCL